MKRVAARLVSAMVVAGVWAPACSEPEDPTVDPITPEVRRFPLRPLVRAESAPPPLDGGTLVVLADGRTAVASDPERGSVVVADLADGRVTATIELGPGARPGRVAEGPAGSFFVTLPRDGAVLRLDRAGTELYRRDVCATPQGLAWDDGADRLHVACESGELVTLEATDGALVRTLRLDRDLRDVVVTGEALLVSRFRAAEVLRIDAAGQVERRIALPGGADTRAALAYRMVASGDGGAVVVHQRARSGSTVSLEPNGYGGCLSPLVESAVSSIDAEGGLRTSGKLVTLVLPVDIAVPPDARTATVIAAGNRAELQGNAGATIELAGLVDPTAPPPPAEEDAEFDDFMGPSCVPGEGAPFALDEGQVVAVAFGGTGRVLQTRAPSRLVADDGTRIELPGPDTTDSGFELFHLDSGSGLACASCHPAGRDDGVVWTFDGLGERRTQDLRGGILGSEPFHWGGDLAAFPDLVEEVFTRRMGGPRLPADYIDALAAWVDTIPAPVSAPAADPEAAERGRALFESRETGCTDCHRGDRLQGGITVDVGTGGEFQVPPLLGVGDRAPYLHDGCAATLLDRFGPCGGGDQHGHTSHLAPSDLDDLVAYLGTL